MLNKLCIFAVTPFPYTQFLDLQKYYALQIPLLFRRGAEADGLISPAHICSGDSALYLLRWLTITGSDLNRCCTIDTFEMPYSLLPASFGPASCIMHPASFILFSILHSNSYIPELQIVANTASTLAEPKR